MSGNGIAQSAPAPNGQAALPAGAADPRTRLADMVREALTRSNAVGAAKPVAAAALSDIEEARSAKSVRPGTGQDRPIGGGSECRAFRYSVRTATSSSTSWTTK